jgi:acyl carrier protein
MKLFQWFRNPPPRGIHAGEAATHWASTRFAPPLRPIAAYVADLVCEQAGVKLSAIEPTSTFILDLGMVDLDSVEFIMALEHDLGIEISDSDCSRLNTVSALVSYLYKRLASGASSA